MYEEDVGNGLRFDTTPHAVLEALGKELLVLSCVFSSRSFNTIPFWLLLENSQEIIKLALKKAFV